MVWRETLWNPYRWATAIKICNTWTKSLPAFCTESVSAAYRYPPIIAIYTGRVTTLALWAKCDPNHILCFKSIFCCFTHMTTTWCQNVGYLNWSAARAHVIVSELNLVQKVVIEPNLNSLGALLSLLKHWVCHPVTQLQLAWLPWLQTWTV